MTMLFSIHSVCLCGAHTHIDETSRTFGTLPLLAIIPFQTGTSCYLRQERLRQPGTSALERVRVGPTQQLGVEDHPEVDDLHHPGYYSAVDPLVAARWREQLRRRSVPKEDRLGFGLVHLVHLSLL